MCVESNSMTANTTPHKESNPLPPGTPPTSQHTEMNGAMSEDGPTDRAPTPLSHYPATDLSLKDKYKGMRLDNEGEDRPGESASPLPNGGENTPASKYLRPSSPGGHELNENGEVAERSMHSMASMHRLGLVRGTEHPHAPNNTSNAPSSDTTKLLRGILQTKKDRFTNGSSPSPMMLDGASSELDIEMREMAKMKEAMMRNGSFDTDMDSLRTGSPGNLSDMDSDQENQGDANGMEDSNDALSYDEKKAKEDGETGSSGDSSEAKRARVENIISGMNSSTSPTFKGDGQVIRGNKRKSYIPQQHDVGSPESELPSSKYPRLGQGRDMFLKGHLRNMQDQLAHMQSKYLHSMLPPHLIGTGGPTPMEQEMAAEHLEMMREKMRENGYMLPKEGLPHHMVAAPHHRPHALTALGEELDPSQFIRHANKLVKEQEVMAKFNPLAGTMPEDLDNLASLLKKEITNSVGSLVDSIVARFVEKQKARSPQTPGNKPQHGNNNLPHNNNNNNNTSNNNSQLKEKLNAPHPAITPEMKDPPSLPKPARTKVTDKIMPPLMGERPPRTFADMAARVPHPMFPPPPYFPAQIPHHLSQLAYPPQKEPEQTEPMSLVISTPKKKRTKVTDTRLSPRAARALLSEGPEGLEKAGLGGGFHPHHPLFPPPDTPPTEAGYPSPLVPVTLPTSVAIPNPGLQHSEVLAMYSHRGDHHAPYTPDGRPLSRSPLVGDHGSPNTAQTPSDHSFHMSLIKNDPEGFGDHSLDSYEGLQMHHHKLLGPGAAFLNAGYTSTLTPMHLRKAKLMFFFTRYPSSAIIKIYFPDVKFNKNNTAQLVKWFSNFREFYYIQMEKYARQALAEGSKNADDLTVSNDSEIYRVLNLHYNRNNQIEVPDAFRLVVQATLREFFKSIQGGKDTEQSWKKAIYKIIARMDDQLPEFFKSPNWMEQLNDM